MMNLHIYWNMRDAQGRTWSDANAHRLREWVRHTNNVAGIFLDRLGFPFRSDHHGLGHPVPPEFLR